MLTKFRRRKKPLRELDHTVEQSKLHAQTEFEL